MNEKICIFTLRILLRELLFLFCPRDYPNVYDRFLPEEIETMGKNLGAVPKYSNSGRFIGFTSKPDRNGSCRTMGLLLNSPRDLNNEHKLLRNMGKRNKQYEMGCPDQEFVKQLQAGLAEDIDRILKDALERARKISTGEVYPEPVIFKSDNSADPDQFKEHWESDSTCACQEAVAEQHGKSEDIRDLLDQQQVTVGKFKLKPCESIIRAGDGKVFHSVCLDDALNILNAEKARSNFNMDMELAEGDQAVDKLKETITRSKDIIQRNAPANTVSAKLPDGEKVTIQVRPELEKTLAEPVKEMVQKELVPPKRKSNENYQEEIEKILNIVRSLRGDDQCDNPVSKLKAGLADIMRGEGHGDEFISDEDAPHVCAKKDPAQDKKTDEQLWKEKKFREYTNEMFKIFQAKNQDYTAADSIGSSFDVTYDLFGPVAPAVRFMDKVLRYVSLTSGKDQKVNDESVADTLTDLANYALLTKLKIEKDERQKA